MDSLPFDDEDEGALEDDQGRDDRGPSVVDEPDLEDRLGSIVQRDDGPELVLTRVPWRGDGPSLEMLRFDREQKLLRIFPRATSLGRLEHQFHQITELQVEAPDWRVDNHSAEHNRFALLYVRGLPKGFGAIYEFGLGIQREYADFVRAIEQYTDCTAVRFVLSGPEGPDSTSKIFHISLQRFADYCAAVDRTRGRGRTAVRRVIEADCHNATAELFGLDRVGPKYGRNPVINTLTEEVATGHVVNSEDRALLASEMSKAAPVLAREAPERLGQLRTDIELVSLEVLIERFTASLAGRHANDERFWQDFFNTNRFALQQVFSTPVVVLRQHAHLQAPDLDGRGARITDFLCANTISRSAVIVEIKTPATRLVRKTSYRGGRGNAAVYPPHGDLSGAISQLQAQMAAVPRDLAQRLSRSSEVDIDPWNDVRGAVIAGRLASLDGAYRESFLRYRAGLSAVSVLGYDEVLARLMALHQALKLAPPDDTESA